LPGSHDRCVNWQERAFIREQQGKTAVNLLMFPEVRRSSNLSQSRLQQMAPQFLSALFRITLQRGLLHN